MHSDSIDTNVIVHGITTDDLVQRKKILAFLSQPNSLHHLSTIALAEAVFVLERVYRKPRVEVANLINFFLTRYSDVIEYDHVLIARTIPFWMEHPKLSFTDCLLASDAELTNREPLVTCDKKLARQSPSAKLFD